MNGFLLWIDEVIMCVHKYGPWPLKCMGKLVHKLKKKHSCNVLFVFLQGKLLKVCKLELARQQIDICDGRKKSFGKQPVGLLNADVALCIPESIL